MNKANTLKECFAILISEYGDRLTPEQVNLKKELFNNVIGNYSPEKIKKMTMEMIRYRKYANFPKIAEMVELIEGNQEEETENRISLGLSIEDAERTWLLLLFRNILQ